MLGAAGSVGVTLKLFPGDRHEILNETDRDDVFSYISGWLEERLAEAEKEEN
jgi:alpha-beta hydrolase superfamily lysophospholipase